MNTYLYQVNDGYIMIDTGYQRSFDNCKNKLRNHNISTKDIIYIFLTHAHDDHAGFINDMISENKDIKVIMSYKGVGVLRKGQNSFEGGCSGKQSYLFCLLMKLLGNGEHKFPPIKKEYEENLLFISNKNKAEIEQQLNGTIVETAGHTDDSISLLTKEGYLFCGDAAMSGFPSKNHITIWIGNKVQYISSWEKMIKLNPTMIYPAHGKPFKSERLVKNLSKIESIKLFPLTP